MRRAGFANERRLTLFPPPPSLPYCCFSPSEEEAAAAAAAAIAFGLVGAEDEVEVEVEASHFLRSFGPT